MSIASPIAGSDRSLAPLEQEPGCLIASYVELSSHNWRGDDQDSPQAVRELARTRLQGIDLARTFSEIVLDIRDLIYDDVEDFGHVFDVLMRIHGWLQYGLWHLLLVAYF